jgi:hypothetical protein
MRSLTTSLALLLICVAPVPALTGAEPSGKGWDLYGAALSRGRLQRLSSVTAPTREGKALRVQATIAEVCQMKGCWMNVADGDDTLRVEFKDYGFFVPSTAAGKPVQMEGIVIERTLSDGEREHLRAESESGKPIPERMHVFVASGVRIQGGGAIPEDQQRRIGGRKAVAGDDAAH